MNRNVSDNKLAGTVPLANKTGKNKKLYCTYFTVRNLNYSLRNLKMKLFLLSYVGFAITTIVQDMKA